MVRCGARYSQSPGVAGLSSAASPRSGRHGGPADNGAHAMDVSTSKHVHLRVVRAGTAGVEPAFRSGWSRVAYPLADPQVNENRPGISWGGCLLRLNASGDNRPGARGKLTLRARLHKPVSFRAVPERHDSMVRDTHGRSNAIFAHLLPGQSHMVSAHPRSPVGSARRDTRIAPRPRRPDLRCARGGVQPGRRQLASAGSDGTARLWDGKAAGALSLLRLDAPTGALRVGPTGDCPGKGGVCRPGRRRDARLARDN